MDRQLERQQRLRLLLREYELMLRQYSEGSIRDDSELDSRMAALLSLQVQRQEDFDLPMLTHEEWNSKNRDNASLVAKLRMLRSDLKAIPSFPNQSRFEAPFVEE